MSVRAHDAGGGEGVGGGGKDDDGSGRLGQLHWLQARRVAGQHLVGKPADDFRADVVCAAGLCFAAGLPASEVPGASNSAAAASDGNDQRDLTSAP